MIVAVGGLLFWLLDGIRDGEVREDFVGGKVGVETAE